jgi:DNA-binding transcriptional MerR regulator
MTSHNTASAAKALGVSKSTLLRWISEKRVADVDRDRNGWRVFTDKDIKRITDEIERKAK